MDSNTTDNDAPPAATADGDPILTPRTDYLRYVLMGAEYPDLDRLVRKAQSVIWPISDVKDLEKDRRQWTETLSEDLRQYLRLVFAFFAISDGIVVENLVLNFAPRVQINEAKLFYGIQHMMENVHSQVYAMFITHLIPDRDEQERVFRMVEEHPATLAKAAWALKWLGDGSMTDNGVVSRITHKRLETLRWALKCKELKQNPQYGDRIADLQTWVSSIREPYPEATWVLQHQNPLMTPAENEQRAPDMQFALRLAAFAAVEMVFFSSSFAFPCWLRTQGLMLGFADANDLIRRDEGTYPPRGSDVDIVLTMVSHLCGKSQGCTESLRPHYSVTCSYDHLTEWSGKL